MTHIKIAYAHTPDWYVGEIYRYFHLRLKEEFTNIQFEYQDIREFRKKYNIDDYGIHFPSILNQYNFLLLNPKNNKAYINSLNDHAPFCAHPGTGIENFDIQKFTFASNYCSDFIEPISKYNPEPSFYILENYSDLQRVETYKDITPSIQVAGFLGLIYNKREIYQSMFKDSNIINILSKSIHFKSKDDYFEHISKYSMLFSLDGMAQVCHRDIEALGLGRLLIREHMNTTFSTPLIPNIHYLEILTPAEKLTNNLFEYKDLIEDRIKQTISNKTLCRDITRAGREWYEQVCLPSQQYALIKKFTKDLQILI